MGNNSVPKFIFRLSRFPVYRGVRFRQVLLYNAKKSYKSKYHNLKTKTVAFSYVVPQCLVEM